MTVTPSSKFNLVLYEKCCTCHESIIPAQHAFARFPCKHIYHLTCQNTTCTTCQEASAKKTADATHSSISSASASYSSGSQLSSTTSQDTGGGSQTITGIVCKRKFTGTQTGGGYQRIGKISAAQGVEVTMSGSRNTRQRVEEISSGGGIHLESRGGTLTLGTLATVSSSSAATTSSSAATTSSSASTASADAATTSSSAATSTSEPTIIADSVSITQNGDEDSIGGEGVVAETYTACAQRVRVKNGSVIGTIIFPSRFGIGSVICEEGSFVGTIVNGVQQQ